jgi:hypothetical protein
MAGERLVEMYARLNDLATLQHDDVREKLAHISYPVLGGSLFSNLSGVTDSLFPLWSTLLQFLLIFLHFAREPEGPTLIVICLSSFLVLSYLYANAYNTSESDTHKSTAQLEPDPRDSVHCPRHKPGISTLTGRHGIDQQWENSERGDKRWTVTTLTSR